METCPHRPPCPGCPRFGNPGLDAPALAALGLLAAAHGLPPPTVHAGPTAGFRHRARLAVRGRMDAPRIGLFAAGSHDVVQVPRCSVHHPLINEVAAALRTAIMATRTPCFSDRAHAGLLRYLQVVVERRSRAAQVTLVINSEDAAPAMPLCNALQDLLGERLHSLWLNCNTGRGNSILGPRFEHVAGPATVVESFGGSEVYYPPGAFGQNNLDMAEQLIGQLRAAVPAGSRVLECHAGVGAIGLSVLERASTVAFNELAPASLEGLALGVAALPEARRASIEVLPGPASVATAHVSGADVAIVDPPRKGLEPALLGALAASPPARLLYVSCSLPALTRDMARLTSGGALRLEQLDAWNLMPFTPHVEVVAQFGRG